MLSGSVRHKGIVCRKKELFIADVRPLTRARVRVNREDDLSGGFSSVCLVILMLEGRESVLEHYTDVWRMLRCCKMCCTVLYCFYFIGEI